VTFIGKWRDFFGGIWQGCAGVRGVEPGHVIWNLVTVVGTGGFCPGAGLLGEVLGVLDEKLP
jgi:hypothetical protein